MKNALLTLLLVLPIATWQMYNPITNTLTVYRGADANSGIYYTGKPSGYDGKATAAYVTPHYPWMPIELAPVIIIPTEASSTPSL